MIGIGEGSGDSSRSGHPQKGDPDLCGPKAIRLRIDEEHRTDVPANRFSGVVGGSTRGLRAFRNRPASRRQRSDLVTLAHIKEQSRLSLGRYGRPRMTEELKEIGLNVGHRRPSRQHAPLAPAGQWLAG